MGKRWLRIIIASSAPTDAGKVPDYRYKDAGQAIQEYAKAEDLLFFFWPNVIILTRANENAYGLHAMTLCNDTQRQDIVNLLNAFFPDKPKELVIEVIHGEEICLTTR